MQPDPITWDEFSARRTALETGEEPAIQPKSKRQASSLSDLLMQAIQLAGARRGRLSRAERIRDQTLLEMLTAAVRSAPVLSRGRGGNIRQPFDHLSCNGSFCKRALDMTGIQESTSLAAE